LLETMAHLPAHVKKKVGGLINSQRSDHPHNIHVACESVLPGVSAAVPLSNHAPVNFD